jgi:hypothetical protein
VLDAELSEAALRLLVPDRYNPHDGDLGCRKPPQYLAVETPQIRREQHSATVACGYGSQQVGDVHAAPGDFQAIVVVLQRGDES